MLLALLGAAITVVACYAAGALLISRLGFSLKAAERLPLGFVLGAACLHLAIFATMALKIAFPAVLVAMLAAVIAAGWFARAGNASATAPRAALIVFGIYGGLYFVNALAPEASADGSGYHLELVARYLRVHGFEPVPTNMYASLGQGVELLFVPAFAIGKHSAAALVHFAFAIFLALAMMAYGRRIGRPRVGVAGALLTFASPIVGKDGTSAYVDVAVAAIAFSVFYWLEIWDEMRDGRMLIPIGLLAGYAYATKYTAFVMLAYALGFVAWRGRKVRPLLVVGSCAALMVAPWMIKNWIYVRNPVAPFFNQVFRNPNVHVSFEKDYAEMLRHYDIANRWTLPIEATMRGEKTQGLLGPVFLAAPLALLALRYRAGRRLLVAGGLLLAVYFTNILARFLIPCLPFFSLAIALALGNSRVLLTALVLFHVVTSWPAVVSRYVSSPYTWRLAGFPYQAALRRTPEDAYLRENLGAYPLARLVEENVPQGEHVLALQGFPQAYTSRDILVSFQGAFNETLADMLYAGWDRTLQPTRLLRFRFPEVSTTRARLLLTGRPDGREQWMIHELRFLNRGAELTRQPEWRLRAFPNPWDVQLAFDNSPVTRWRTWETAAPGMYLDVDFGRAETLEEVRVETSRDSVWPIRLEVQSMNAQGKWVKLADHFEEQELEVYGSTRRAATAEMHARGVNYLLVGDMNYGADDYRNDPHGWGLTAVARVPGATLYKVTR